MFNYNFLQTRFLVMPRILLLELKDNKLCHKKLPITFITMNALSVFEFSLDSVITAMALTTIRVNEHHKTIMGTVVIVVFPSFKLRRKCRKSRRKNGRKWVFETWFFFQLARAVVAPVVRSPRFEFQLQTIFIFLIRLVFEVNTD